MRTVASAEISGSERLSRDRVGRGLRRSRPPFVMLWVRARSPSNPIYRRLTQTPLQRRDTATGRLHALQERPASGLSPILYVNPRRAAASTMSSPALSVSCTEFCLLSCLSLYKSSVAGKGDRLCHGWQARFWRQQFVRLFDKSAARRCRFVAVRFVILQ